MLKTQEFKMVLKYLVKEKKIDFFETKFNFYYDVFQKNHVILDDIIDVD